MMAFQSLFRYEYTRASCAETIDSSWIDGERLKAISDESMVFARFLIQGTIENLDTTGKRIRLVSTRQAALSSMTNLVV